MIKRNYFDYPIVLALTHRRRHLGPSGLRRRFFCLIALAATVFAGCSATALRYTNADLAAFRARPGATELPFHTEKGKQVAYYLPPGGDLSRPPHPLIILFPGIESRALDRLDWTDRFAKYPGGILLIDYPGRGQCEGLLRPAHLPHSYAGALQALSQRTGLDQTEMAKDMRLVGHSFGTAAALRFAQLYPCRRIILLAPMTTIRQAMFLKVGPLAWLIPDNLDNQEMIIELTRHPTSPTITIVHGERDTSIPPAMGKALQQSAPLHVELVVLSGGTHMSILTDNLGLIEALIFDHITTRDQGVP